MENIEVPQRRAIDDIEIGYLCCITSVAVALNAMLLSQLLTRSRQPTVRTSFSTGPYQMSSFSLFKINLCISDFGILLIYAMGKIIWLTTYQWRLGDYGCKAYQFFSALSFYASSNIIVAIGLDRLKVVYTKHLQGATSVRRVRLMITFSWALATVCSIPQLFVWKTIQVNNDGWSQCVSIFQYHQNMNTSTPLMNEIALVYEMSHQATVFWIPFTVILASYVMIVLKILVYHTLRTKVVVKVVKSSETDPKQEHRESLMVPQKHPRKWSELSIFSAISTDRDPSKPRMNGLDRWRTGSMPAWRRQLRSRVFRSALAVVVAHIAMWLPYNCISTLRFINFDAYNSAMSNGGNFLEDLIVVNSLLNPLLYGHRTRPRRP